LSREQVQRGDEIDLSHKRMGREGPRLKRTPEIDRTIRQVNKRTKGRLSVRAFHAELQRKEGVDVQSHTTVHKWLEELDAFKHKRSVIPTLTHDQRVWRVDYCLNMLGPRQRTLPEFYDVVHVDEKWFWLMPDGEIVRGIPEANGSITLPSPPTAQHKNAIPKAMFLTANARPRPEYGFNGKLGIWRVTGLKEALRKSKNHERGDTYEVDVSITAAVYRRLLEEKVYPAIKQKMWWKKIGNGHEAGPVFIVQDGATPHTAEGNEAFFLRQQHKGGFDIRVIQQPAQSPDLNFNDCSFFRSIHCFVRVKDHRNLNELARDVLEAYEEFPTEKIEHCWQVLFRNIMFVLRNDGSNDYKNLKTKERTRRRHGGDIQKTLTAAEIKKAREFTETDV